MSVPGTAWPFTHHIPTCVECGDDKVTVDREWVYGNCDKVAVRVFESPEQVSVRELFPNRAYRRNRARQEQVKRLAA